MCARHLLVACCVGVFKPTISPFCRSSPVCYLTQNTHTHTVLYARLLAVPLVMSYHTHIPEYIPRYTWSGLVQPMWSIIRWCTRRADLTLVTSKAMKVWAEWV